MNELYLNQDFAEKYEVDIFRDILKVTDFLTKTYMTLAIGWTLLLSEVKDYCCPHFTENPEVQRE